MQNNLFSKAGKYLWGGRRAASGTRTRDPQLGKLVLYQLSYCRDVYLHKKMEPIPGLEPGTHALRMRCSTN